MRWPRIGGVSLAFAFLLFGTVLVFQAFDRDSHSASDTIRPFFITMAPVWAVAIWAAAVLLRRPSDSTESRPV
jgi:hypothetical protein